MPDPTKPPIPYGRHLVDDDDIAAVIEVLRGDWLTTGPAVDRFEGVFAGAVDATNAVAVANGTAALHLSMLAAGIGPGDEVIVPALTFAASANAVRYVGADVVFADVREDTLTLDPTSAARLITPRTRAIVAVDYSGTPCDLDELVALAEAYDLTLIEDACHAPGATYRGRRIGGIAHLTCFSFHPVKHITTGEGGMVTTQHDELAARLRRLRSHGIDAGPRQRAERGTWAYDISELGFNYRLSDINAALGASQVGKLAGWLQARSGIADRYQRRLAGTSDLRLPEVPADRNSAWHLYPVRIGGPEVPKRRQQIFEYLHAHGVQVNVHYVPVHRHSYYRSLGYPFELCPVAEAAYDGLLSLPMWPGLTEQQQDRVMTLLLDALGLDR